MGTKKDLELSHEAVIRLCRFGYVGPSGWAASREASAVWVDV